jgi:hypothetical protein
MEKKLELTPEGNAAPSSFTMTFQSGNKQVFIQIPNEELFKTAELLHGFLVDNGINATIGEVGAKE